MHEHAVRINRVSKRFGSQLAVDDLDLLVPSGSIYGFIGPNGSGKTTTMRMILRIYQPDEGEIEVLGESTGKTTNDQIGYLPEERGLYRRMTVKRVLKYFARLKSVESPASAIDHWLERLDATEWANKRIEQLSKGMAQKIQFIAAVIAKPKLMILDEPFSGLDPVNLDVLRDAIFELRDAGSTILFSTHDMDVAERMCDRVFMIFRGRKVLDGSLDEVQAEYGDDRLRVRLAGDSPIPQDLNGVTEVQPMGRFTQLGLADGSKRSEVLQQLAELGDVEHFEIMRPSLHDIFVNIAGPDARQAMDSNPATEGVKS